jgi:hypothetical protein
MPSLHVRHFQSPIKSYAIFDLLLGISTFAPLGNLGGGEASDECCSHTDFQGC